MPADYRIYLNFLPIIGQVPAFRVYRQLRSDLKASRPANLDVQGYSLPIDSSDVEKREHYWVGFSQIEGYSDFTAEASFNNDLTRWAVFKSLYNSALRHVNACELWIPERGFSLEIHFSMRMHKEG